MIIEETSYLKHYGKKGMKWGVRRQRDLDFMKKVGSGKATRLEKFAALNKLSLAEIAMGKGIEGASRNKARAMEEHKRKIQSGEVGARDILTQIGTTRLVDLGKLDR